MRRLVAGLLVLVQAGCSLVLVRGPDRAAPRDQPLVCTRSSAAPTIDIIAGVTMGLGTAYVGAVGASLDHFDCDGDCSTPAISTREWVTIGLFTALAAVPWFISSGVGSSRKASCRRADRERAEEPLLGSLGHGCRHDGTCLDGLACAAGSCRPPRIGPAPRVLPGPEEACLRDPDLPVGLCAAALVCIDGRCRR